MPIFVACPKGHRLRVADGMEGRRVRCPTCMQIVTVPKAPAEPPPEEAGFQPPEDAPEPDQEESAVEDRPRRSKGKRRRRAARQARRLGLKIVGWGLLLNALSVIAAITAAALIIGSGIALIAIGLMAKEEDEGPPAAAGIAAIVAFAGVGLAVIGPLLGGVGKILCCWVPREAQGRGLVITSIVCDAAQFVVPFIAVVVGVSGAFIADGKLAWGAMILQLVLNGLALGFWLASLLMFLIFLSRVAEFVGEEGYAEDARNLMKWAVFIGTTPVAMVVLSIIPFCGGCMSLILAIALIVVAVLFIIGYLRLLFGLRYVVS